MVFPRPHVFDEKVFAGVLMRRISRVFVLDAREVPDPLYSEVNPDFALRKLIFKAFLV